MSKAVASPFVKWAGGKRQLISTYQQLFPVELKEGKITEYVEPFVGGGAILFHILQNYKVERAYINDINAELINCYKCIKENVKEVIARLTKLEKAYHASEDKKSFYYEARDRFNSRSLKAEFDYEKCADFILLNRTCYNGLYRVNRSGKFNVPCGRFDNPIICDRENLELCSKLLQKVEISAGDYQSFLKKIKKNTFVYFDPPYRPLVKSVSFTSYDSTVFNDEAHIRLADNFKKLNDKGCKLMLSNSDPKNVDAADSFFDELYKDFDIKRVNARRIINCQAGKRSAITEIVVTNYKN